MVLFLRSRFKINFTISDVDTGGEGGMMSGSDDEFDVRSFRVGVDKDTAYNMVDMYGGAMFDWGGPPGGSYETGQECELIFMRTHVKTTLIGASCL